MLRLYAPHLIDYNIDEFALKVIGGNPIRKLKDKDNQKMTDARLVEKISEQKDFEWVIKVYEAGNAFVHYSDQLIFASMKTKNREERIVNFTVGKHDNFIPLSEKHGAICWMHEITDGLIFLTHSWVTQKQGYKTNGG